MFRTSSTARSSRSDNSRPAVVPDVATLESLLKSHRVDLTRWGQGNAKTVESLYTELASGEIELHDTPFRRVLTGVVQLIIRQGDNVLIEAEQVFYDGRRRARNIPPAEKMLPGESYIDAAWRCLSEELQIDPDRVEILEHTHTSTQDLRPSWSYPGLLGQYTIHRVEVQVDDLPQESFWTAETSQANDPTVRRHLWAWVPLEQALGDL